MHIQSEFPLPEQDKLSIIEKLDSFGEQFDIPKREHTDMQISLRDDSGRIRGAFIGYTYWNWLYIEFL